MPVTARYEYVYGSSQTGRFLREYLYDGFNADEQGRKTFDAVWAHLERLMKQRLSATDFFARINETSVLVSLPSQTSEEAQICCLRIAQELHTSMLGPSSADRVFVRVTRAPLTRL